MRRFVHAIVMLGISTATAAAIPTTAPAPAPGPATMQAVTSPAWWTKRAAIDAAAITDPRLLARLADAQARVGDAGAWRKSLDLAERGAAQIPDAKKQCEAYLAVAEVCAATGERNGYLRCIKAARRYLEQSTDIVERSTTSQFIAVAQAAAGDTEGWNATVQEIANLHFRADICIAVAQTLVAAGDKKQYQQAAQLGQQAAAALNEPMATSMLLRGFVAVHAKAGDFEAAGALADSIREPTWKAMAYASIADEQIKAADLEGAKKTIAKAEAVPLGQMVWGEMELLMSLAALEDAAGNKPASDQLLKSAHERADAYINSLKKAVAHVELAATQLRLGDKAGAAESIKSAEASRATMPSTRPVELDLLPGKYSALAMAQAASGDLAAARATAKAISQPELRLIAYAGIARELAAASRFDAAVSLIGEMRGPETRLAVVRAIAARWARSANPQGLMQWMESLPTPLDRAEACIEIVLSLLPRSPRQP